MPPAVLTIAHSNHPLERLLALLARHGVEALADIRRFPRLKEAPALPPGRPRRRLAEVGVEYHWLEALGSCRASGQVFWPGCRE
jgi:uncharacterized protein (DUF488 family)